MDWLVPWILVALVAVTLIDRLYVMWSIRTRESEVNQRAENATRALSDSWEQNKRLQHEVEKRDAVILAFARKPQRVAKKVAEPAHVSRETLNGTPRNGSFEGLRGPR